MLKGKGGKKSSQRERSSNISPHSSQHTNSLPDDSLKNQQLKHEVFPHQSHSPPSHTLFEDNSKDSELSLRDYWETVMRYRVTVIIIISISIITAASLFYFIPKKFTATAKVINKSSDGGSSNPLAMMGMSGGASKSFDLKTIIQIAKTDKITELVFKTLDKEFSTYLNSQYEVSMKEQNIFNNITKNKIKKSLSLIIDRASQNILLINVEMPISPHISAAIANTYSNTITKEIQRLKHEESYVKVKTFENLTIENQKELENIDENIRTLSKANPENFSLTSRETLVFKKLTMTESQLQTAKLGKREIEDKIRTIKSDFGISNISLDRIKWVDMSSSLQRRLQDLKYQREELLTRYKPENPSVKKLSNQIASLQETLIPKSSSSNLVYVNVDRFKSGMVSTLLSLNNSNQAIIKRIKFIEDEIKTLNKDLVEVPEDLKQLRKLSAKKQVLLTMQITLQKQLQQEKVMLHSMSASLDVLEKAKPNLTSSSSGMIKFILGGAFIGIALGITLSFILNNWENTIKSSSDLKRHFSYPSLGVIPQWNNDVKYIDQEIPDSNIAEVYGMLRNNVRFCGVESPEKGLMIASASQTEGKSLTTVNLCLSFALEGNSTILISSDLRRAYSHTQFKQKEDLKRKDGMVEYLEGKAKLEDIIYESTFSNFSFIPTCTRASNPTKLLKSQRFDDLFSYAEKNYDTVIIDTPAILPVVDATIFASKVRGVLIIVHANQTPITAIQESINRLKHVGAPIIGMALNRIKDLKFEYFYGYGISNYAAYKTYS